MIEYTFQPIIDIHFYLYYSDDIPINFDDFNDFIRFSIL